MCNETDELEEVVVAEAEAVVTVTGWLLVEAKAKAKCHTDNGRSAQEIDATEDNQQPGPSSLRIAPAENKSLKGQEASPGPREERPKDSRVPVGETAEWVDNTDCGRWAVDGCSSGGWWRMDGWRDETILPRPRNWRQGSWSATVGTTT